MALSLVDYDKAVMLESVKTSFAELVVDVYESIGISITAAESYKYEWEIVEELRERIKNPEIRESAVQLGFATTTLINNAVTDKTKLRDLVELPNSSAVQIYSNLVSFIEMMPVIEFQPPLGPNMPAMRDSNELVYSIPNYPKLDPRRTGRIVRIGPKAVVNPTLIQYLVNNAGRFGFVFYGPLDPTVWYWRGDKLPVQDSSTGVLRNYFTPLETVTTFSSELIPILNSTQPPQPPQGSSGAPTPPPPPPIPSPPPPVQMNFNTVSSQQ